MSATPKTEAAKLAWVNLSRVGYDLFDDMARLEIENNTLKQELEVARKFHAVAVVERDAERHENLALKDEIARLRHSAERAVTIRTDATVARGSIHDADARVLKIHSGAITATVKNGVLVGIEGAARVTVKS